MRKLKNLRKKSLDELLETMPTISDLQLGKFVGGGDWDRYFMQYRSDAAMAYMNSPNFYIDSMGGLGRSYCMYCTDYSTLGRNLFGSNYTGGNNPLTYGDKFSYSAPYKYLSDGPSMGHDRRYDYWEIEGLLGVLTDTRVIGADLQFIAEQSYISMNPSADIISRVTAGISALGIAIGTTPKTLYINYLSQMK